MNQTNYPCKGPQCFGKSKRTSFVDVRDDDIPGPGSHNSSRIDRNTPTKWKFSTSTERDSFLQKYPRPYPSPDLYSPNAEPTLKSGPQYSIPKQQQQNPAQYKGDDLCTVNYKPNSNFNKTSSPFYSFGYTQERDYGTTVPPPNTYRPRQTKSSFNKTQNSFTKSSRPLPYGEQGRYPGIGNYNLNKKDPMNATAHVFGSSQRPQILNGPDAPGVFYQISQQIKQPGKGYTMRPFYQQVRNKQKDTFPGPDHYNPKQLDSRKKIISFTGQRSELYNKDLIKYPSPQKHVTSPDFYKTRKSLSFTKQLRYEQKPKDVPGPGKYNVATSLNNTKGYMGKKIKDLTKFVTPGADNYRPKDDLTKPNAQRTVSYYTNRTDFSKSITGKIGPGVYQTTDGSKSQLGRMSKSLKFDKNRNKNPGPGFYEIPGTIGRLPKYYCAQKKLTTTGFSTHALAMTQRTMRMKQHQEQLKRQKQLEQQRMLQQMQQSQQK